MYNGRHISKRIAKLLVVIVVRRILARGLEVLLSDAVRCLRPLAIITPTPRRGGIENYNFVLPIFRYFFHLYCTVWSNFGGIRRVRTVLRKG